MSSDPTESVRREEVIELNSDPGSREALAVKYGQVWDTQQLREDFDVTGFLAPYVVVRRKSDGVIVRRKSDGVVGSLQFQHQPRYYFAFKAD